jgi:hypothetical protein
MGSNSPGRTNRPGPLTILTAGSGPIFKVEGNVSIKMYRWRDTRGAETVSAGHPPPPFGIDLYGGQWPWKCIGELSETESIEAVESILGQIEELMKEQTVH